MLKILNQVTRTIGVKMNRVERNSIAVAIVAMIIFSLFIGWVIVMLVQVANDDEICKQPLDKLNRADYQFCLSRLK